MTDVVVCRKTDGQNVCIIILTQLFTRDCLLCKRQQEVVREWCVVKSVVKSSTCGCCSPGNRVGKCVGVAGLVTDVFPRW